jgi:predicted Zn-ribbon and HTH transcriptional regulator
MQKEKITCKNCGYEWTPRTNSYGNKTPLRCPLCQRLLFTKEEVIQMRKVEK